MVGSDAHFVVLAQAVLFRGAGLLVEFEVELGLAFFEPDAGERVSLLGLGPPALPLGLGLLRGVAGGFQGWLGGGFDEGVAAGSFLLKNEEFLEGRNGIAERVEVRDRGRDELLFGGGRAILLHEVEFFERKVGLQAFEFECERRDARLVRGLGFGQGDARLLSGSEGFFWGLVH